MEKQRTVLIILAMLAITGLLVPTTGAVFPGGKDQTGPIVPAPDLNVSGTDIANRTMPAGFQTNPIPVRVEVMISDTLIPGPKGEMQAGPRSIGFTLPPALLLVFALAVVVIGAGTWYILKKKPAEETAEERDEEENKEENGE
jgi:hypothetical protein